MLSRSLGIISQYHKISFNKKLYQFPKNIYGYRSKFYFSEINKVPDLTKIDQLKNSLDPQIAADLTPKLAEKIEALEKSQPFFDRLIFFDPDFMATLPFWLDPFDPVVETAKNYIVMLHDATGLPWWSVISLTCIIVRTTIMPLIYLQFKRASKVASIIPVLSQVKKLTDKSKMEKKKKWFLFTKIAYKIVRKQQLKSLRLVIYNLFHFPLLITLVWTMRRILIEESVKKESLLWVPSLCGIDPYYILPFATVGAYYWNLQRFITKENQHTLISRLKSFGQVLLILWLPLLCNWPAAIVWYMFSNAIYSILQTTMLVHPAFYRAVDPKMVLYQFVLRIVEYDKVQSKTLVDTIKTGQDSFLDKAIKEEDLIENFKEVLKNLNAEKYEHSKNKDSEKNDKQVPMDVDELKQNLTHQLTCRNNHCWTKPKVFEYIILYLVKNSMHIFR